MANVCSPADIDQVKAILEAVNALNQEGKRDELIRKIKRCASQTGLSAEVLRSSLEKISGITPQEINQIVPATPPQQPPPPESGAPPPESATTTQQLEPQEGSATEVASVVGGKRKSKKSKSKKRRSRQRKYRKIRRTRR